MISFGKFSYVISIPKKWIKKNKLGKKSEIYIEEDTNKLILSSADKPVEKSEKEIVIMADNKPLPTLKIQIISAYINNHNLITVKSENTICFESIKEIFHSLIALEIIEQDKHKIVAKDFLNYEDASVSNLIRRVDNITRSMVDDSINYTDKDDCDNVIHRDFDVNRLCYLSQRVIKTALNDANLSKSFKMTNSDLMDTWIVITSLEKIADAAKRIARLSQEVTLSKKEKDDFVKNCKKVQSNFLNAMKSFHTSNVNLAFDILDDNREEMTKLRELAEKTKSPGFTGVMEQVIAIQKLSKGIAQVIINKEQGEKNGY